MEEHKVLKGMMDLLFGSMNLNSWTISENKSGYTVCVLRFKDCDNKSEIASTPVHYKRKSTSQQQRDKCRIQNFNRIRTRSQVQSQEHLETNRDIGACEYDSETGPITPDCVSSVDPHTPPHLIVDSPHVNSAQSSVSLTDSLVSETMSVGYEFDDQVETCPAIEMPEVAFGDIRPLPNPDPPPDKDEELIASILNKPDEDVTLKDILLKLDKLSSLFS